MVTTLVIDGYNAINAIPATRKELKKDLRSARRAIILAGEEYARSSGYIDDVCVVFDGLDKYRRVERSGIPKGGGQIFSGSGKGDDKIIETVKRFSVKGRVVLASNDNYVRNNARAYGAAILDVRELAGKKKKKRQEKEESKNISRDLKKQITEEYRKKLGV
ncbi:MAG: NYN domain-containing protein [Candidatus Omnitrophota bacterium]